MAWKQTGLVGTPYWEEPIGGPTGEKVSEPEQGALESTLELVKKSLWTLERHTQSTSGRLDKNNQSGPSYPLYKISKWGESAVLDMMLETLVEMQHTLETSSIARHSKSPLETSIASLKESTVSFNEKTERWHDDQTNLMVKGTDPRVAEAMKPKPSAVEASDEMVTEKKVGLGVLAGFLDEIKNSNQLILETLSSGDKESAEDEQEGKVKANKAAKEEKKQTGFLQGMWNNMKEKAKKSWFAENWKMIAAGLLVLLAPLEWIKKLWEWAKKIWEFIAGKKVTQKDIDEEREAGPGLFESQEEFDKRIAEMNEDMKKGTRVGGLFGKGGPLDGFEMHLILGVAALALFGPAVLGIVGGLIAGFKMIKGGIGMVTGAFKGVKNFAKSFTQVKDPGKAHAQALKENAKRSKVAGTAGETGAKKTAEKAGTKAVTKTATKGTGKAVGKGLGKSLLKKIPGIGLLFGAGFAVSKAMAGDFTGAGMELASGAMSIVPGIGTAGSVAMDAAIMARDMGAMKGKEKAGKKLGETLNKEYKEGKQESDKAVKVTTTHKKGTTPMGPSESIKVEATSGEVTPRMSKLSATKRLEKMRKRSEGEYGMSLREKKRIRGLLVGGQGYGGRKEAHHSAVEMWKQMTDEERKMFAKYKPKGADDTATIIPTPPRGDFKTKIPQVGLPEKEEPTEGEPSKWLPFGHDKSAFKKQTSFGDKFKNLAKFLWGDKKPDEKKGAEPATGADAKSVEMAVARWVKNRKGRGRSSADDAMKNYIKKLIGFQDEARLALLEKKLKSLDTEKVGGSSKWFKRSGFEKEKDAWVVTTPGVEGVSKAKMHRKGMGADSSIARAWSGEEGAMEVAKERFPGMKFTPAVSPDDKMNAQNALQEKNQTLQGGKSGPVMLSSQTNYNSQESHGGTINTFSQNQVRSNKTLPTSSVQR